MENRAKRGSRYLLALLCVALICALGAAHSVAQESGDTNTSGESASDNETSASKSESGGASSGGIDIEINVDAGREQIALALPSTRGGGKLASKVHSTLERDFELSGYFKILPADSFFFDPSKEGMKTDSINFENWTNVGAQGLVKSSVSSEGDKVTLDLRFYDVTSGKPVDLDWSASGVTAKNIDDKVHEFVNAVLEKYTGKAGPFGTRIAFVKRNSKRLKQIYTMEMDGTSVRTVTSNSSINLLPSWGGGDLFYTSYRKKNPDLWVYRNGKHKRLSHRRGQNTGASYCKGKLALTLSMGGENADIYLIDPKTGRKLARLTDHWAIDTSPTWSPDCSQIAFVSGRSGSPQIYVMSANGKNQRRLTYKGRYNTTPEWSPSGDTVVFTGRDERNVFDIFTVDLDGNIERLTQNQGNNEDPTWSPNGNYIAFTSTRGGKGKRIWLMTSDGSIQKLVTRKGSGYTTPSWKK
jgi:TolB protein